MSFLLKIVEGPNKGAEIALVEGVAVTIGKGDDCDIVLADLTLPDNPLKIEASADGVTIDGDPVEPLEVKTIGATSFAVGPAETAWGALKWSKKESESHESPEKPEFVLRTPVMSHLYRGESTAFTVDQNEKDWRKLLNFSAQKMLFPFITELGRLSIKTPKNLKSS